MNFQVERSTDDGDSGPVHPCCAICMGILLIVVAPYVIWHTEGDYIKTLEVLDAAGKGAFEPCKNDRTCSNCDFSKVNDGDLIYLACPFNNLKTLTDVRKEGNFNLKDLEPAVAGDESAAAFSWSVEMFQFMQDRDHPQSLTVTTAMCFEANFQDTDEGRRSVCCSAPRSPGAMEFQRLYVGPRKTCHPAQPRTSTGMFLQEIAETAGNNVNSSIEDAPAELEKRRRLRKNDNDVSRDFKCYFDCRHWTSGWSNGQMPSPAGWRWLPDNVFPKVEWVEGQPAANIPRLPFGGSYSNVKSGPDGVSLGGVTLQSFKPEPRDQLFEQDSSAALSSQTGTVGRETLGRAAETSKETKFGTTYAGYRRSQTWTSKESTYSVRRNCFVSSATGDNNPQAGDLRLCFKRSSVSKVSVLAGVKKEGNSLSLVVSDTHLRAQTELRAQTQGYRLRKDVTLTLDKLLEMEKTSNENMLYFGRIVGPLILWAAFYCFLSPLIWVFDKFGDTLKDIPCVGGLLGMIADFVETLVTCLVCAVSCSLGLACGLMAMAVAWVAFRPLTGIALLAVSIALFAAVIFFGINQRGQKAVRRRSARQPAVGGQSVEMNASTVQPAAVAQPAVAAPAVAVAVPAAVFQVQCPDGVAPGTPLMVTTPDGRQVSVQVPAGVSPGQMFQVQA